MTEWIVVDEYTECGWPKHGERVLVIESPHYDKTRQRVEVAEYYFDPDQTEEHQHQFLIDGRTARVTHFCEFPPLPITRK